MEEGSGCFGDGTQEKRCQDVRLGVGEEEVMMGSGGMSVMSDVRSARKQGWEWRPDVGDA